MAPAGFTQPHLVRAVRRVAPRRRLDGVPAGAVGHGQAFAVGPGAHGDPRDRARSSARPANAGPHPCRSARCPRRAVGYGGGGKMLLPLGRNRRNLGRSARTRFYRDPAPRGRVGAERNAVLAGAARRHGELERRTDALADRIRTIPPQRARSESAWAAGVGLRAVPGTRNAAGPVEHRA